MTEPRQNGKGKEEEAVKWPEWMPVWVKKLFGSLWKALVWVLVAVAGTVITVTVENRLSQGGVIPGEAVTPAPEVAEVAEAETPPQQPVAPESPAVEPATAAPSGPSSDPDRVVVATDGSEMVYVEAGQFDMGTEDGPYNEKPVHSVLLDAFYIDRYEVTNGQYAECVEASVCTPPSGTGSGGRSAYYGNAEYDAYPVIFVNWFQAKTYCTIWRDDLLPTEAQWEKAAGWQPESGASSIYPWGEQAPSPDLLNYSLEDVVNDTMPVGTYPDGASALGVHDLLGNVWEWVEDWYSDEYYHFSPDTNPTGPAEEVRDELRAVRGGSWLYDQIPRVQDREGIGQTVPRMDVGFRCASTAD